MKGEGLYPGRTLYQMVTAIQRYLVVNKLNWNLVYGPKFGDLKVVLDNVMKERTALNIGVTKRQVGVISYQIENQLWEQNILGDDTPDKLRNTVLFLIGVNIQLRAVEEHYDLRREMPTQKSQLQFERNSNGERCIVYREDFVTKTHDGGLKDMRKDRKVVWVYSSSNINRCPVQLIEKYLSLCPLFYRNFLSNFYLRALQKPTPKCWYAEQVVGENTIGKVVKKLMEQAKIEGFFTNHSLRRSGGTRLFLAGVDRKIVKEVTGHLSDAVDKYQVTSEDQQKNLSKIIGNTHETDKVGTLEKVETIVIDKKEDLATVKLSEVGESGDKTCNCKKTSVSSNVSEVVEKILNATSSRGKTVIKIEIEIHNE